MSAALGRVGWRGRDTAADGEGRREGEGGEETCLGRGGEGEMSKAKSK